MASNGEPIADDELDEHPARRSRSSSSRDRARPVVLRDPHRGRARAGSPTSRSTSRWSRSGWAARGTRPTWSTADVAVVTNVSIDHVEYLGTDARGDRDGEGGHREARVDARARRDRSRARADLHATAAPARCAAPRRRLRCARATCSRSAAASSTSTRPTRAYPDVFLPLHGAHQADNAAVALAAAEAFVGAPLDADVVARRVRARAVAGPARGRRPPAARAARRRAQRRRRARRCARALAEEFAPAPRTLVVGLLREKDPHEMLARARPRRGRRSSCAAAPPSPRALDPAADRRAPRSSSASRGADRGRRLGRRGACRRALLDDARRTVRSSSPARSTSSARPASRARR